VSISAVVHDLDTTASGVQSAIALEALVSAAFILIGSKIADLVGRKRAYDPHRDLPELHGLERPAWSNTPVPRGSHHISSLWSPWLQPVAISGKSVWRGSRGKQVKNRCRGLRPFTARSGLSVAG